MEKKYPYAVFFSININYRTPKLRGLKKLLNSLQFRLLSEFNKESRLLILLQYLLQNWLSVPGYYYELIKIRLILEFFSQKPFSELRKNFANVLSLE
jgi:hypothetical protein